MTRRTRHDRHEHPVDAADPHAFVGHPDRTRRRKRATLAVPLVAMTLAAGLVAVALAQAPVVSSATADAASVPSTPAPAACLVSDQAALVPDDGALLGVNLDWSSETLAQHAADLGEAPAVAVQFSDIPYDRATWDHTLGAVTQLEANGGILLLTLEPHGGLATLSDEVIAQLVDDLADINLAGVRVIVRLAHEMNGSWYAWGQQPTAYIDRFRAVADAVHAGAPGTSMMWAPNYGGGYPFSGGQFEVQPGTVDFAALDTDGDGALTMSDDPYSPYFPGDDYVDWVGISLYHWGNQRPWGSNEIPEAGKFAAMLTGTYSGTAGDDSAIPDFYQVYGVEHGHPVAVPETAAIYTPSRAATGASELDVKQAWWRQVFSDETHERFPQLKMINWFEWQKVEIEIGDVVDWRAASSPEVHDAFVADLPDWLRYADETAPCG